MIETIFTWLSEALYENTGLALFASFGWGVLSILLSPCHLSSIPLIIGYISSRGKLSGKKIFLISLVFSVGILITIALIGLITALMGRLLGDVGQYGNYLVAGVFFVVGLYLMDIIKLPWDAMTLSGTKATGLWAALVLGLLFGIGLGPCTFAFMAPILGVVFSTAGENLPLSIGLLVAFSLGHIGVIVAAGSLTNVVQKYLNFADDSKTLLWVKRICGVLVILGGIYLILTVN
ncbi:MAG: cytochrome C biogenesis protein [Ignavibacteriaceae bacterium]|nr:cytochrome C biogenesis protein [Ignavibacteriaceae bacterium]